jgi:hypothetical protein
MFKKNKPEIQTTWSEKMLEGFIKQFFNPDRSFSPVIPFIIMEKITAIDFNINQLKDESIIYRGIIPVKGLEYIYFFLSTDWPTSKKHKGCIGYLELVNGKTDLEWPVPMIRGFIRRGLGFFTTVNLLLRDSEIFAWKHPIGLHIQIFDDSGTLNFDSNNIIETELGIESVQFYQKLKVFEQDDTKKFIS